MIYPVVPRDKKPIIHVWEGRCAVARFIETAPFRFDVQLAANWEALEAQACQAVEDQMGAVAADYYPCPYELAELAVWPAV